MRDSTSVVRTTKLEKKTFDSALRLHCWQEVRFNVKPLECFLSSVHTDLLPGILHSSVSSRLKGECMSAETPWQRTISYKLRAVPRLKLGGLQV